jgi:hypothetical protein
MISADDIDESFQSRTRAERGILVAHSGWPSDDSPGSSSEMRMSFHIRRTLVVGAVLAGIGASASAQSRVDKNVVYGMYSGAALLLDVHYPAKSNGFGVIFISGSGWNAPLGYSATPLKVNVPVKLMRIEGADHGPDFPGAKNPPDYKAEIVRWLDTYLRKSGSNPRPQ